MKIDSTGKIIVPPKVILTTLTHIYGNKAPENCAINKGQHQRINMWFAGKR